MHKYESCCLSLLLFNCSRHLLVLICLFLFIATFKRGIWQGTRATTTFPTALKICLNLQASVKYSTGVFQFFNAISRKFPTALTLGLNLQASVKYSTGVFFIFSFSNFSKIPLKVIRSPPSNEYRRYMDKKLLWRIIVQTALWLLSVFAASNVVLDNHLPR